MSSLFVWARRFLRARGILSPKPPRRREYFFLGEGLALVRLARGHLIYVDPIEESVCTQLITHGFWESWVEATIMQMLRPGDHVVEVGAHVGYFTLAMAERVGSTGSVIAFEANPRLAKLASKSLGLNGFAGWARVVNQAVSDTSGPVRLATSRRHGGGGHLYVFDKALGDETEVVEIEAVRLDDLELPDVRLIRIDAEGSEALILTGADRLLRRPDVVLCIEWDVLQMSSRSNVPAFVAWLAGQAFRAWRIQHDGTYLEVGMDAMIDLPHCDLVICRQDLFVASR